MPRWTLLQHDTPDGGRHFDLLLAPDDGVDPVGRPDERRLMTFRLPVGLSGVTDGPIEATRVADHRARYLEYSGPISGGRGEVQPVGGGVWRPTAITEEAISGRMEGLGAVVGLRLARAGSAPDRWQLRLDPGT